MKQRKLRVSALLLAGMSAALIGASTGCNNQEPVEKDYYTGKFNRPGSPGNSGNAGGKSKTASDEAATGTDTKPSGGGG